MKVIIPMAGKGTRLRPHTYTKAKPLIHVAGKPILAHILDCLKNLDISKIIFITGHLKETVEDFVKENYDFETKFIEQKVMDGTAGAVKLAEEYVDEDVLIIFVDTIFETDLGIIKKCKNDGIIWAKEVEDYQRFGIIIEENGIMKKIVEKPTEPISKLANIGLHYIKNYKLMFEGIHYLYKNKMNPKGEYYLTDAFQYMIEHGAKIQVEKVEGWYDCGKIETLLETNRILLEKYHNDKTVKAEHSAIIKPVFIEEGCVIRNSVIGPNVSIASGVIIENSIVKNSILDKNSKIVDAQLTSSVIGENTIIKGSFKKLNIGDSSEIHYGFNE